ncbi:MAG TPA: alpha/beta fold hydrolase, partial [Pseudomonas sp.]|nr:alpha/beta fold hydrolase [Pseudomonas sp.]
MQWIKALTTALAFSLPLAANAVPEEASVQVPGPHGPLVGSLLTTSRNAAVVIIIPGSGPTDRNGNNRQIGLTPWTYKLLAQGLAEQGIASLRIDKRGIRGSAGAAADPGRITLDDYASDVKAWTKLMRQRLPDTPVWLLGHSQGGTVALLAAQSNADIQGLVLAASAGRRLDAVILEQLHRTPESAPLVAPASAILRRLMAGETVDIQNLPLALQLIFNREAQAMYISELALDPVQLIADTTQPTLILQGGQDLQITQVDARLLKAGQPNAQLLILEHANHVLKDVPAADRQTNLATYSHPRLPLAEGLVRAVSSFIIKSGNPLTV